MKRNFRHILAFATALMLSAISYGQQKFGGIAEFDSTTHDFGDVMLSDGALSCSFNVRNISDKPMAIYSVVSSCGCTNVEWTREPIKAGASGTIKATYSNDEGPYPFDKTLTVYISNVSKPVTLRLRGVTHQKKLSLEETYTVKMGSLAVKTKTINGGALEQGNQKSDVITVANLSSKAVKLSIGKCSEGISVKPESSSVPAKGTANLTWTITADRSRWGANVYEIEILADGKSAGKISVSASTKENFSSITKAEKDAGSRPMFTSSTYTFNRVKAGTGIDASFSFTNSGKSSFKVYKVDSDNPKLSCSPVSEVAAGGKGTIKMHLDTTGMPSGEVLIIVTLTTNSPLRPVINLFVTGWIE